MSIIKACGLIEVELLGLQDVFAGSAGQASAEMFDTKAATIRARKP